MKITNEEYEAIVKEIAGRVKDCIFMDAERIIRSLLTKEYVEDLLDHPRDTVRFKYICETLGQDFVQILGRLRRSEFDNNKK